MASNPNREPDGIKPGNPLVPLFLILLLILVFFVGQQLFNPKKEITFGELDRLLEKNAVKELIISGLEGTVKLKEGYMKDGYKAYRVYFHSKEHVRMVLQKIESLRAKGLMINYKVRPENTWLNNLLFTLFLIFIFILFVWFFLFRQFRGPGSPGNIMNFGRSRARRADDEARKVTFNDVAGVEEAKEEVKEIVEFLKNPKKFTRLGGRIPRGVLLVGPPGTGKTLLAKAIAGEAKVPFFSISGSDFVEMFVGVGASRVRDLFQQARENSPCIIFLDEIDAVGRKRGSGLGGGHDEREQTLNAILVEMDGFDTDEGIIVIAATNRPDVLDPALLRPGRFDRQVTLDLPDLEARLEILKVHAKKIKISPHADLEAIARSTATFSGAELAAIINEAAIAATMKEKDFVEQEDLEEARDKVRWGRSLVSRMKAMEEEDKRITAYHESGHAIIARALDNIEPLHKVTIIPQGRALGLTMLLPKKDQFHMQRKKVLSHIKLLYGGRIAEQHFCGDISSGAQNDIERATDIARAMVCEWGMSEALGPVKYSEPRQHIFLGSELGQPREYSEATAQKIDEEVRRILEECYQEAEKIILENKEDLIKMAEALIKFEQLTAEEIDIVLNDGDLEAYRHQKIQEREKIKEKLRKEEEARRKAEEKRRRKALEALTGEKLTSDDEDQEEYQDNLKGDKKGPAGSEMEERREENPTPSSQKPNNSAASESSPADN
ncbi:MAG: ATP-dependent zinc metalloprotease FtsH [Planctomycetota bacterium]|nr:MAG: ATP-dependent zinc metalloprotease FtsH [Planctomycetota bacterium]